MSAPTPESQAVEGGALGRRVVDHPAEPDLGAGDLAGLAGLLVARHEPRGDTFAGGVESGIRAEGLLEPLVDGQLLEVGAGEELFGRVLARPERRLEPFRAASAATRAAGRGP